MKNAFILVSLYFIFSIANAQEGFWSIEQLYGLQPKIAQAGLPFSSAQIRTAKHGGFAQSVIRFEGGNATFINKNRLAIGMLEAYQIPDSIWSEMENGVWIAAPGQGIRLNEMERPVVFLQSAPTEAPLELNPTRSKFSSSYERHIHAADGIKQKWYAQDYQILGVPELIGVFRIPASDEAEYAAGVILRIPDSPTQQKTFLDSITYRSYGAAQSEQQAHLVLGHPEVSSIHRSSFELQYALEQSRCHQDLDRALGEYLTRSPFITQEGVFRIHEDALLLEQTLKKRALLDAEFRHALSTNAGYKAQYGSLLDSCRVLFKDLLRYVPAQVYTKGIIYSPCSFFESVRLFTMWRGRIGSSAQRKPTVEESQYFPEVFKRVPPTENEFLLPELFQRYFTQLPAEHLAPYAAQQAIYAQKDYIQMSETLLQKSLFSRPERIVDILNEDFLTNINLVARDPAVQLVDSMLLHYGEKVVPQMERLRRKALQKNAELIKAMSTVLPHYPTYPDADHTLRVSYGILLETTAEHSDHYWLSNAHLTESHRGSPVINAQGQLIGMVRGLGNTETHNAYYYDPEKSRTLIWRVDKIRERIAAHPNGHFIISEWP